MVEPKRCGVCGGGLERYRKKWCAQCALELARERRRRAARERYDRVKDDPEYRAQQRERDSERWANNPVRRRQCLDRRKRWDKAHAETERARSRHKTARRRAQIKTGDATVADIRALVARAERCAICRCKLNGEIHVDHIIPLAAGGRHTITNLRATCPRCNVRRPHDGSDVTQLVLA